MRGYPASDYPLQRSGGEDALGVSHERFQSLKEEGAFAMHWQANGLEYGIPVEIDQWLDSGRHVLVNGSRGYLKQARERYPDLLAIMLYVDTGVLHQRLQARGRETPAEISDRLQRNQLFIDSIDEQHSEQVSVLNNSAALSLGVQGFLALIDAILAPAAHSA